MKKLTLTLISVLLFIYALLSLLSFRDAYCAEHELWGIDRKLIFIASHQESTPDYTVNQLADRYQAFVKEYDGTVYAKHAQLMLGDLYSLRKNYVQARLEYEKAVGADKDLSAQAEVAVAKTYELEGHWDKASAVYKGIIQDYPDTNLGFSIPMYLTSHYGDYADALSFYQRIALKYPRSRIEFNALRMVALCQLGQKDWSGTVKTMGEVMLKYPVGKAIQEAVSAINLLCITKLHDYDMGINIYEQFIQKYPDHSADPVLEKMIKDFQLLKNKKLIVKTVPGTVSK